MLFMAEVPTSTLEREDVNISFLSLRATLKISFYRHVGVHFVDTLRDGIIRHHASIV